MYLKLVMFPLMATGEQLFCVVAMFKCADIRAEVTKNMAPRKYINTGPSRVLQGIINLLP
jgi:hypothetical protein